MAAKTILVTGGAGYIGSHTALELLNSGYKVVIVDNLYNASIKAVLAVERLANSKVEFYHGDSSDKGFMQKVFSQNEICAVIHFAGYKAVGESVREPLRYYRNNLDTTLTLLEVMQQAGVSKFVFSSSATVYSNEGGVKYNEEKTRTGRPFSPYGTSKLMQEYILDDATAGDDFASLGGLQVISLRYFNPVGAHPSGELGENPLGVPNNLAPFISQVAVGRLPELKIFGNDYKTPDGTCLRDYIHVCDLARGHLLAVERIMNIQGKHFDAINLGAGNPKSVLEVLAAFEKAAGKPIPHSFAPRRPGDLPEFYADPKKAKTVLGFSASADLAAMAEDTWRWQTAHPKGF